MERGNLTNCSTPNFSENYILFSQLVDGVLTTICVLVGTIGNLHCIKLMHRNNFDKNRGVVFATSILSLAIWDIILLWCSFFYYSFNALVRFDNNYATKLLTPWFHGFSQIASTASVWCVAVITVQRLMASRDPFRGTRNRITSIRLRMEATKTSLTTLYCSTYRRHFRVPLLLSFVAIISNIPAFFELHSIICKRKDGKTGYQLLLSKHRLNPYYQIGYKMFFRMLITSCAPNIAILLLTGYTIYKLRGSHRLRRQFFQMNRMLPNSSKDETSQKIMSMISLILVIKYLLFRTPSFILDIIEITVGRNWTQTLMYVINFSNFLVILNSATNCVIIIKISSWMRKRSLDKSIERRTRSMFCSLESPELITIIYNSWTRMCDEIRENISKPRPLAETRNSFFLPRLAPEMSQSSTDEDIKSVTSRHASWPTILKVYESPIRNIGANKESYGYHPEICKQVAKIIDEIIIALKNEQSSEEIQEKIRLSVDCIRKKNIFVRSSVWCDLKSNILETVKNSSFPTNRERKQTFDAWNSFISFIIGEMRREMVPISK